MPYFDSNNPLVKFRPNFVIKGQNREAILVLCMNVLDGAALAADFPITFISPVV
jgi:hypothetical protein